ncbi:hypothetical protein KU6B_01240 [Mameliella alba]|nr:hypothetical protein KU6B_01240 [Mameliella alba]
MNRDTLKRRCLGRLDECGREHPTGHQGKLAARYLLDRCSGDVAEVTFEKVPKTPANIWVERSRADGLIGQPGPDYRIAPASVLFATKDAKGWPVYGRHSALKPMHELGQ